MTYVHIKMLQSHCKATSTNPNPEPAWAMPQDVAIAYGYNNIGWTVPRTSTVGSELPLNALAEALRAECAMAGYTGLASHPAACAPCIALALSISLLPSIYSRVVLA